MEVAGPDSSGVDRVQATAHHLCPTREPSGGLGIRRRAAVTFERPNFHTLASPWMRGGPMTSQSRFSHVSALALAPLILIGVTAGAATPTWQDKVDKIIGWEGETTPDNVLRFTLTPNLR